MSALLTRQDNSEVVVIEVVKKLSRSMPVTVTSHPVETGSSVSDHATRENKKFTLEGVISDASFSVLDIFPDIRTGRFADTATTADSIVTAPLYPRPAGRTVVTTNRPSVGTGLTAGSGVMSRLKGLAGQHLGFITQFTTDPIKVSVTTPTPEVLSAGGLASVVTAATRFRAAAEYATLESWRDDRVPVTLTHSSGIFQDCMITDIQVDKDASVSNNSFVFTLQLEQIQIVDKAQTTAIAKRKPKVVIKKPAPVVAGLCSPKVEPGKITPNPVATEEVANTLTKAVKSKDPGTVIRLLNLVTGN